MVTYRNKFDASNLERFIAVYELDRERSLRTRPEHRPARSHWPHRRASLRLLRAN